ncbi:MAG: hypothetical protein XU08_C0003G0106 [candidate division WWE3 bacterium CSP1-7]|uniref:Uncharacterized protein n=1 Tax=candidate division WWE3 bacterium CSP1-7 TaxID=1576480 RepID=A0A0T5ZXJ7_UNCKA|nr:MAG: hypothetical protein XU08_C0003G0106 [candidate division WWE3 bacterium CSP1-7]
MGKRSGIAFIFILIIAALAIGTVAYVGTNPDLVNTITQKIKDIITPGAPIGNLTPARDLTGTWVSSLKGKGMELYGSFPLGGAGTAVVYQNSDVTLKITSVSGNTASGTITYTNLCTWGSTTVTGYGAISTPKTCVNVGATPISIRVSGSRLDFGTVSAGGATVTMQGNFTTDLISGTMTMTSAYGVIKGEFHLIRKK